jgi:hypothetical protein
VKATAIAVAFVFMIGVVIWLSAPRDNVEYHKNGWFAAVENLQGAQQNRGVIALLRQEISRWFGKPADDYQAMRQHERALLRLGYLVKQDFHLTNQVLTREFHSNFYRRVQQTFGTNWQSIWTYGALTNQQGLHATLPAKDLHEWERIFREYAARHASNLPPPVAP